MLIPIKWLNDYVDIAIEVKSFGDAMTMSGSNVEKIEEFGKEISGVVVGKIIKQEKHPDADKLSVNQVDIGSEVVQIVTGATNVKVGDYIPIAINGSTLPGGVKIKKGKLRGVESNGMMCSPEELGMDLESVPEEMLDGIYLLHGEYQLGSDVKQILGLDDKVIEFEITNNRPDCMSVIGIAREAAATLDKKVKYPNFTYKENKEDILSYIKVQIDNEALCRRYSAKVIKNIKITESPAWMQDRLIKSGLRPKNNIVDITNYVMLELGQPMHAFDYDKLVDKKIVVRNASHGEIMNTLDGKNRQLEDSMLVIVDNNKPIGIAGVMGGENSEIDETTTTIVFESANFEPVNIRLTSKKLGLRTDASSRYEKGIDTELNLLALNRACSLVEQLNAGDIVGGIIDIYPKPKKAKVISLRIKRVQGLMGIEINETDVKKLLNRVNFETVGSDIISVTIPTYRDDVEGEADLIEEIARLYGYENIPSKLMDSTFTPGGKSFKQKIVDISKTNLVAQGLFEAYTYSFVSPNVFNKINLSVENPLRNAIKILNPLGEDQSIMRTTIIPNIMDVVSKNFNKKISDGSFFELSKIYLAEKLPLIDLAKEYETLTMAMYGKSVDFFSLKGVVENLLKELKIEKYRILPSNNESFHPGSIAELLINNKRVGFLGEIHPDVSTNYNVNIRVYIAELNFEEIISQAKLYTEYKPLPKYPAVDRDIAIVVSDEIIAAQVEEIVKNKGGKLVEEVTLFDIYRGNQVPEGYKSMAYKIIYRSDEKTLTEEDISKVHNKILHSLYNQIGASLRQ